MVHNRPELLLMGLVTFVAAYCSTRLVRYLALKKGWLAMPRYDRWHTQPVALHGGVGFYPVFIGTTLWALSDHSLHSFALTESTPGRLGLAVMAGSLLMFVCGVLDDISQYRPAT